MRVRRLGEGSSNITYDYKNSSIENNFLIKFQNFYRKHFLVTLYICRSDGEWKLFLCELVSCKWALPAIPGNVPKY